ncbi:MAG: head-tail connector protein [Thiotrichaceae bacterium]
MRSLKLITAPASQPLMTLVEAKAWLKVTHDSEDDLITGLIPRAVNKIQRVTNLQLFTATYDLYDNTNCDHFPIPKPPVTDITTFSFVEIDGTVNAIDAANWNGDVNVTPAKLNIIEHAIIAGEIGAVDEPFDYWQIRFEAGYGTLETDIPEELQGFGFELVAQFYAMRLGGDAAKNANMVIRQVESEMLGWRVEIL